MAITWTEDADSRQNLGPSGIIQQNTAAFSVSDYPGLPGYPVYASAFGMSHIRGLIPIAYSSLENIAGTPGGYVWQYFKPAVSGPAATNPGYLVPLEQSGVTGALVPVTGSNVNFSGGTVDFVAYGW
jgi:hypothetical protein